MNTIPTIFKRGDDGKVVDEWAVYPNLIAASTAYEKWDGIGVRLTVRKETCVRLECRRNPTKEQKASGIIEPWYRDARVDAHGSRYGTGDVYVWNALENTVFHGIHDGEWHGEAVGPGIQGNPKNLPKPRIILLEPELEEVFTIFVPEVNFNAIRDTCKRLFADIQTEGIVWWDKYIGPVGKIKAKDFA